MFEDLGFPARSIQKLSDFDLAKNDEKHRPESCNV
jgi:hypothetical protein